MNRNQLSGIFLLVVWGPFAAYFLYLVVGNMLALNYDVCLFGGEWIVQRTRPSYMRCNPPHQMQATLAGVYFCFAGFLTFIAAPLLAGPRNTKGSCDAWMVADNKARYSLWKQERDRR
mgnify:CR=1 FL=1